MTGEAIFPTITTKRLAIIGCGSSGLVCLKYALDELSEWEITAFEKSDSITGCWGNPPDGFVSTSTKYTTQFACFPEFDASVCSKIDESKRSSRFQEFFCNCEYGQYLERFAARFDLTKYVERNVNVNSLIQTETGWELTLEIANEITKREFDAVVICTGLADRAKPLTCDIETLRPADSVPLVRGKCIVVIGGGESAVDMAQRLSNNELGNQVYLSLRSGVRVSPRYHPIRGVPSDFLRTRFLLSFHPDIRNWIGQKFVEFRIVFQKILERLFPSKIRDVNDIQGDLFAKRKFWSFELTRTSKERLFNMYHNKSDEFLNSVAAGDIEIIGPNADESFRSYFRFDSEGSLSIEPDLIVPAIGYSSGLPEISDGLIALRDFYLACAHGKTRNLFAVGFTRPVIGNIPSTSELQAKYVCGLIAGKFELPADLPEQHSIDRKKLESQFPKLDKENVWPIEMIPYGDRLCPRKWDAIRQ